MKKMFGGPGTVCGLILRIGQCVSAFASMFVMGTVTESSYSYNSTAFHFLSASMSIQALWSFCLACAYYYALRHKEYLQTPILVSLFVVGDFVTAMLSLAAACSSAGVVVLYAKDAEYCHVHDHQFSCLWYEVAVALAFVTWVQIAVSFHVSFWIYASV